MKRGSFFYSVPDCGCGGSTASSGSTSTASPKCDDKYLTLSAGAKLKSVGVLPDSNCLGTFVAKRGFVFDDGTGDGQHIEDAPKISLPSATVADGWPFMLVAVGSAPNTAWKFVAAPASGTHTVQVEDGLFVIKPTGQLPGFDAIYGGGTADMVFLLGGVPTGTPGQFETKRLTALEKRVVVGFKNPDNTVGFKSLADADPLEHPVMKPDALKTKTYSQRDSSGADVTGGIPVLPLSGVGAPGDAVLGMYSPTTNIFYRAPARAKASAHESTDTVVPDNGAWQQMGAHCSISGVTVNYPDLMVHGTIRTLMTVGDASVPNYNMDFGLFLDGVLQFTWDVKGAKDNTVHRMLTGIAVGSPHTIEIRVRKTAVASQTLKIIESNMDIYTVL